MTLQWSFADIAQAVGAPLPATGMATGISIDSRTLEKNDLFIALHGPNHDGHDYLHAAMVAGAAAALVKTGTPAMGHFPLFYVDDTFVALEQLGRAARARARAKIIAVTGSVGKTGTKEMLKTVLSTQGTTHASVGSFNNHWGVPLSLARMPADCDFAIFELGMNHAGEIAALVNQVRPHAAIITTVDAVHLENFANLDGIADAKGEILSGIESGGVAILNRDNKYFDRLTGHAHANQINTIWSFGEHDAATARLINITLHSDHSIFDARIDTITVTATLPIAGKHIALNALAVLLGVRALGGDIIQAATDLAQTTAYHGRGQRFTIPVATGDFLLIDDSYNASPTAIRASLAVLGAVPAQRRIAILGDMLELGAQSPTLHAGLCDAIQAEGIDMVHCAGPLMKHLYDQLPAEKRGLYAASSQALSHTIATHIHAGDAVLVKGSAGSKMNIIVDTLRHTLSPEKRHAV